MNRIAAIETAARRRQDDEDAALLSTMGASVRPEHGAWSVHYRRERFVSGPYRTRRDAIDAAYDRLAEWSA